MISTFAFAAVFVLSLAAALVHALIIERSVLSLAAEARPSGRSWQFLALRRLRLEDPRFDVHTGDRLQLRPGLQKR